MIQSEQYQINHSTIKLKYGNRKQAISNNAWLEDTCEGDLFPALQGAMQEVFHGDYSLALDHLVIDLGVITQQEFRSSFSEMVKKEMIRQLQKLRSNSFAENKLIMDYSLPWDAVIRLNAMSYYLERGYFPSWSVHSPSLQELIGYLFTHATRQFVDAIKKLGRSKFEVRKRIAVEFSNAQLDQLIRLLEPSDAHWIFTIREELSEKVVENEMGEAVVIKEELLNLLIINYLLEESGSRFNKVVFTESLLYRLANHYNLEINLLVSSIYSRINVTMIRSVLFDEFKKTILLIRDNLEKGDGLIEVPEQKHEQHSIFEDFLELVGDLPPAINQVWHLLSDREKLTYLLTQHTDIIFKLTEKQLVLLIQLLEVGNGKNFAAITSAIFSEVASKGENKHIDKKEYLRLSLLNWLKLDHSRFLGERESWFASLVLTISQKGRIAETGIERLAQLGQTYRVSSANYILQFLENPESTDFCAYGLKSFYKTDSGKQGRLPDLLDFNLKKTLLAYLSNGAIPIAHELISLQDLQEGIALSVARKESFLMELLNSSAANLDSRSRLSKLFAGLPDAMLVSYFKAVYPELEKYMDFLAPVLKSHTNTGKREQLLSELFTQFRALNNRQINSKSKWVSSLLMLFFSSYQSLAPNGKDRIFAPSVPSFSRLLASNFNYLKTGNKSIFYLRVLLASSHVFSGSKAFFSLNSNRKVIKELLAKPSSFNLRTVDFHLFASLMTISGLNSSQEKELLTHGKDFLHRLINNSLERDFELLQGLSLKWDYDSGEQKVIKQLVNQIWEKYGSYNSLVERYFDSQPNSTHVIMGVMYYHLSAAQQRLAKKTFSKYLPEKLLDRLAKDELGQSIPRNSKVTNKLLDFGPLAMDWSHVPEEALDQIDYLYAELYHRNIPSKLEPGLWKTAIKKATLYTLFWKGGQDSKLFFKAWLSNFKAIIEPAIIQLQQAEELANTIRNSNALSSQFKEGLLGILESTSTNSDISSFQDTLRWIETYSFLERNGVMPWWSPQKDHAEFLREYLRKISHEKPRMGKLLQANFTADSFQRQLGLLSIQNRQKIMLELHRMPSPIFSINELTTIEQSIETASAKVDSLPERITAPASERKESKLSKQLLQLNRAGDEYSELLRKMTFQMDEGLLLKELFSSSSIREQIKELLVLAPFFFVGNLNPGIWRWMVFSFGWSQQLLDRSTSEVRFFQFFFNFLVRNHSNHSWKAILLEIYQVESFQKRVNKDVKKAIEFFLEKELEVFREETNPVSGERVLLANSGVILCWPFLSQLFSLLEFTKAGKFQSDEMQQKAALLIQFIAFGDVQFPEYELVLNKILTGIPLEKHLDRNVQLLDKEKEMALSLFDGIRNNWDKMKSASVQAIRETFLQRSGYLTFEETYLKLEIEKKGVDVLLDSIPWGLSMVKLPWMTRGLEIIWR